MNPHTRTPGLLRAIREHAPYSSEIIIRVAPTGEVRACIFVGLRLACGHGDTIAAALQQLLDDVDKLTAAAL